MNNSAFGMLKTTTKKKCPIQRQQSPIPVYHLGAYENGFDFVVVVVVVWAHHFLERERIKTTTTTTKKKRN